FPPRRSSDLDRTVGGDDRALARRLRLRGGVGRELEDGKHRLAVDCAVVRAALLDEQKGREDAAGALADDDVEVDHLALLQTQPVAGLEVAARRRLAGTARGTPAGARRGDLVPVGEQLVPAV